MSTATVNPKEIQAEEEYPAGYKPEVSLTESAKTFLVSWGELENVKVRANDEREAWAIFCDANKFSPNPKTGRVRDASGKQLYPPETIKQVKEIKNDHGETIDHKYVNAPNPAFKPTK